MTRRLTLPLLLGLALSTAPIAPTWAQEAHADHEHGEHEHDEHDSHGEGHAGQDRRTSEMPPVERNEHAHDEHAQDETHDDHAHDDHAHEEHGDGHGEHGDGHGEHGEHADEVTLTPEAIERHGIRTGPVGRAALASTFAAPGRVAFNAEQVAHVGSVLSGRITEVKARIGDVVAQGDPLLVIESPELAEAQSDFLQKRTAVSVADAAVDPARQAYERARSLHQTNEGIALAEVQRREAEWKAAQGALATAKAAASAAENKLHVLGLDHDAVERLVATGEATPRAEIRAPIAGQVIEREVTLGELVGPDRDALLILANMDPLWVIADVSEARLGDVAVGSNATVHIAALPTRRFDGTVSFIAPVLDAETRTIAIRIEVPNPDGLLRPGMFARVDLASGATDGGERALVVPQEAVQTVEGEPSVFVPVAGEPNTFARRRVTVGRPVGGAVPVLDGLDEGQQIVTSGTFILKAELGKSGAGHDH